MEGCLEDAISFLKIACTGNPDTSSFPEDKCKEGQAVQQAKYIRNVLRMFPRQHWNDIAVAIVYFSSYNEGHALAFYRPQNKLVLEGFDDRYHQRHLWSKKWYLFCPYSDEIHLLKKYRHWAYYLFQRFFLFPADPGGRQ